MTKQCAQCQLCSHCSLDYSVVSSVNMDKVFINNWQRQCPQYKMGQCSYYNNSLHYSVMSSVNMDKVLITNGQNSVHFVFSIQFGLNCNISNVLCKHGQSSHYQWTNSVLFVFSLCLPSGKHLPANVTPQSAHLRHFECHGLSSIVCVSRSRMGSPHPVHWTMVPEIRQLRLVAHWMFSSYNVNCIVSSCHLLFLWTIL